MIGQRQVVVTGMGWVTSLGSKVDEVFDRMLEGHSGIRSITRFNTEGCPSRIGGTVEGFSLGDFIHDRATLRHARMMDPVHQWAMCAARNALLDAGLEEPLLARDPGAPVDRRRVGIYVGTGLSGRGVMEQLALGMIQSRRPEVVQAMEGSTDDWYRMIGQMVATEINPLAFFQQCPSMAAAYLAMRYGAMGPNLTVVSLCAASAQAIGEAAWIIARGDADVMIAGGADSMLNVTDLTAFAALDAVSGWRGAPEEASKPFDQRRDGCVVGEGAAFVVLESLEGARRRGAPIHAELAGYGTSDDAYKISAPPEDGEGAVIAMHRALETAGMEPEQVDHINAHGTSTPLNDRIETTAIKNVFGAHAYRIPVVSTKSMMGHLIAGAGALEAIVSIQSLLRRTVHPTINLQTPDPFCDLDYVPGTARRLDRLNAALSNSFAIGGVNATLLFRRVEAA